jgi:transcriptional regulator with GAF, ATPase, and Fis domain
VDVRVIAATNRDLSKEIADGTFREDLYYRLNVFPIRCPPLRERTTDIQHLVEHFLEIYTAKVGKSIPRVPDPVMQTLTSYHWPGNVRELENIIERAVILTKGPELEIGDWFQTGQAPVATGTETLEEHERRYITEILEITGWKVRGADGAAAVLDVKPTTLEAKMARLGIERP